MSGKRVPKASSFGSDEGVGRHVDVVADDHQVADAEGGVDAAGCIGDEEVFDAEAFHHAHGEGHFRHRISFVIVKPSLHGEHGDAAERA